MGIWEFIGSTAEAVKRNTPDATPVKNSCRNSYTYGSIAFTKIDQAVRINGLYRLGQWMPDDETKSKIGMYTTIFAKNAGLYALQEGYKLIPGQENSSWWKRSPSAFIIQKILYCKFLATELKGINSSGTDCATEGMRICFPDGLYAISIEPSSRKECSNASRVSVSFT
ncbi:hypothetical protein Pfo_022865 [Paulownia fortunei]|nr:hypothetical protein Pfo_022865 [Paulownia fortunei]